MHHLIATVPLIVIVVVLAVLLMAAIEVGRRAARRERKKDKDAGNLAAGMLGIFALLIAFTYSLSLARYDARRAQVLEEANAIGTTANYALMLPADHRAAIMPLLRGYAQARIDLGSPYEENAFAQRVARSNAILSRLWQHAVAITAAQPQSLPAYRFIAALNEQTNIAEARVTALRNHVPVIVLFALVGIAMVALGFAGWSAVLGGNDRQIGLGITAITIALLIGMTIDLDRPNRGSIEISKQPLRDALEAIPAR